MCRMTRDSGYETQDAALRGVISINLIAMNNDLLLTRDSCYETQDAALRNVIGDLPDP